MSARPAAQVRVRQVPYTDTPWRVEILRDRYGATPDVAIDDA
jgi:hypothetical protein